MTHPDHRQTDGHPDEARDARLRAALQHAPDHADGPPAALSRAILDAAHAAAHATARPAPPSPASAPQRWAGWLLRGWHALGTPRPLWAGATAVLLVSVLTVRLWVDEPVPPALEPAATQPTQGERPKSAAPTEQGPAAGAQAPSGAPAPTPAPAPAPAPAHSPSPAPVPALATAPAPPPAARPAPPPAVPRPAAKLPADPDQAGGAAATGSLGRSDAAADIAGSARDSVPAMSESSTPSKPVAPAAPALPSSPPPAQSSAGPAPHSAAAPTAARAAARADATAANRAEQALAAPAAKASAPAVPLSLQAWLQAARNAADDPAWPLAAAQRRRLLGLDALPGLRWHPDAGSFPAEDGEPAPQRLRQRDGGGATLRLTARGLLWTEPDGRQWLAPLDATAALTLRQSW